MRSSAWPSSPLSAARPVATYDRIRPLPTTGRRCPGLACPSPVGLSWTAAVASRLPAPTWTWTRRPFTPVVGNGIGDASAYFAGARFQPAANAYSPWSGSLSAGDQLLMVNDLGGTMGLFTAQPAADGRTARCRRSAADASIASTVARSSRAVTGRCSSSLLLTVGTR